MEKMYNFIFLKPVGKLWACMRSALDLLMVSSTNALCSSEKNSPFKKF